MIAGARSQQLTGAWTSDLAASSGRPDLLGSLSLALQSKKARHEATA
jgi:hypothetical protein